MFADVITEAVLSLLKTLSVGLAGVWTRDLPLSRPALSQLSQPGGGYNSFYWNIGWTLPAFLQLFFSESCLSGHGLKNLFPFSLQKLNLKIVWLLNAVTSQAMERTESVGWLRMVPLLNGLNQILFVCNSVISNNVFTKCTKTMKNSVEIMCIDSCLNSSTIQKGWREKRKEVAIMYSSWFKEFYSPLRQNHLSLWDANSKVHHQQVFWAKYLRNNANTCYN